MYIKRKGSLIIYTSIILMIISLIGLYSVRIYLNNEKRINIERDYTDTYEHTEEEEKIISYVNYYAKNNKSKIEALIENKEGLVLEQDITLSYLSVIQKFSVKKYKVDGQNIELFLVPVFKDEDLFLLSDNRKIK